MKVSAVGFLFRKTIQKGNLKGDNYTCVIHKIKPDGNYSRNVITSPLVKSSKLDVISPKSARADILSSLSAITRKNEPSKFIGATIKDGIKETEVHSLISDKLFAVRTKDAAGKNHFRIMGKEKIKKLLSDNLYV